ncbi:ABC transporter permease [Runella limosa]|uniref:ABC transporter permease n=1 Tax=Runella limosa TaxID=370978 RepID=UPI00041023B4|nr:ABC transporter permease [Runella limosa]
MLQNYLKIAFRNLARNKVYSFINITGLAMGIAAFVLILQYVSHEKSFNQFHVNAPSMYRLLNEDVKGGMWGEVEPGWATRAKQRFPEIKNYCRFADGMAQGIVRREGAKTEAFRETNISYAEGNFFSFFNFPLTAGAPKALEKSNVVFLSASYAKKYFGTENPLGKVLMLSNQFDTNPFTVEGVYADMPTNSDIRYDMVFSLETLRNPANLHGNDWANLENIDNQYINTFFQLNGKANPVTFEKKLTALRNELSKENDGVKFRLVPLKNVHLAASLNDTYLTQGNLKYVYMLGGIAFLILVIGWFNYVNLSTAQSLKRANEVGVRKVVGATQSHLVRQFLGESLLVNLLSFGLALLIVVLLQPFFNELIGTPLSFASLSATSVSAWGLGILLFGSLLSGGYTAFLLSSYNPIKTLKGQLAKTSGGGLLRKSLVVFQFAISVCLVVTTLVIYRQLHHMQTQSLGLNPQQLLVVRGPEVGKDATYKVRQTTFQNELTQQTFVKDYATSGSVPSGWYNFATSGFTQPKSKPGDELISYSFAIIGDRFLKTYQIDLKAGRSFTPAECDVDWNQNSKVLLNERAVELLGFANAEEALRTKIKWDERYLDVIGVVKNYHHTGLKRSIDPIIFYPQNNSTYFTIRLTADRMPEKIAALDKLYKTYFPGNPFDYSFVDDNYNKLYVSEQQYSRIFTTASLWAIFIACLGLFGLATFTVESRTKEIGIRKVLGASVFGIMALLSKDFLKLVLIAILIASPIAWYLTEQWLKDFASRITVSWWLFAAAGMLAIGIACLTVGFQSVKAALMNPVKSLKTE